jgi:hypothetical protein
VSADDRRARPLALALAALLALGGAPGCSFLLVRGPAAAPPPTAPGIPPAPEDEEEGCTTSVGSPVVDVIFGAAFAGSAAHQALRKGVDPYFEGGRKASVAVAGVGALLLAASAYYGFRQTAACRRLRAGAGVR